MGDLPVALWVFIIIIGVPVVVSLVWQTVTSLLLGWIWAEDEEST